MRNRGNEQAIKILTFSTTELHFSCRFFVLLLMNLLELRKNSNVSVEARYVFVKNQMNDVFSSSNIVDIRI